MQDKLEKDNLLQLNNLLTEKTNEASQVIDLVPTINKLAIINEQDQLVAQAITEQLPQIAIAVDLITNALKNNGRLIYIGAGTSGRLGVLDAVECPATYGVDPQMVVGLMAGGYEALFKSKEGAEDSYEEGKNSLLSINITDKDVICGIAASGRTPYVIGALDYASKIGAKSVAISCNKNAVMSAHASVAIEVDVGSEVISGSTRMKAGTAQKMILNMISTVCMINLGKVYKNHMVDVQCTNQKLEERGKRIIMQICNTDIHTAQMALKNANNQVKAACVMIMNKCDLNQAMELLDKHNGFLRSIIN